MERKEKQDLQENEKRRYYQNALTKITTYLLCKPFSLFILIEIIRIFLNSFAICFLLFDDFKGGGGKKQKQNKKQKDPTNLIVLNPK